MSNTQPKRKPKSISRTFRMRPLTSNRLNAMAQVRGMNLIDVLSELIDTEFKRLLDEQR